VAATEIIESHNGVTLFCQPATGMTTDISGCTGYQYIHLKITTAEDVSAHIYIFDRFVTQMTLCTQFMFQTGKKLFSDRYNRYNQKG